jgi:hypothetical protein
MPKPIQTAVLALACVGLLATSTSCRRQVRKPVFPTHGQVFDKNNRPATGALVIFNPVDAGPAPVKPVAHVDQKGNFALTTYDKDDGGPAGEYIITIEWRQGGGNPFGGKESHDSLKGAYSNPKTSKLKFKIEDRPDNTVPPIRLQ